MADHRADQPTGVSTGGPVTLTSPASRSPAAAGAWFLSDSLERPDPGRPLARAAVVARLLALLAQPVGV